MHPPNKYIRVRNGNDMGSKGYPCARAPIFSKHCGDDDRGRLPKAVLGWVREGVAPSRNGGPGVLPPEKFWKYMFKIVHFRATIVLFFSYKAAHGFCAMNATYINFVVEIFGQR